MTRFTNEMEFLKNAEFLTKCSNGVTP